MADGDLKPLFEPRSIALVGASRKEGSLGRRALRHVVKHGYRGTLHLVHPTADELEGVRAVRTIAEIDPVPDLAFICTDGDRVLGVVDEAVAAGVPALAAIASSGAVLHEQDAIRRRLEGSGARMLGPNSPGFVSVNPPVAPHISNFLNRPSLLSAPIGLITHSGAVGGVLADHLLSSGVGLDWLICTGNEFDVGMGECLEYLAGRDLRAIGLFVEAIRDLDAFRRGLDRAAEHGIAVLAVKVGRSDAGARQALTHTGALTGDSALFERELARRGGYLCETLEQLAACLAVATLPPTPASGLAVAAASGGLAGLLGDLSSRSGIAVPDLDGLANPWDTDAEIISDPPAAIAHWRSMLAPDEIGAGIMGFGSFPDAALISIAQELALDPPGKPVVLVPAAGMPAAMMEPLRGQAVSITDSGAAVKALRWWFERSAPPALARTRAREATTVAVDEADAKALLRSHGIPVPDGAVARSAAEAAAFAERVPGSSFVLKCLTPALAHKAAAGGVRLGLSGSGAELEAAWDAMAAAVEDATGTAMTAALIEAQAEPGIELIVSLGSDPEYGAFLAIGAGGGDVERDPDVVHRLLPAGAADVSAAFAELRIGSALRQAAAALGEDGPAPAALLQLVLTLASLAGERPGITVELNPVIVAFGAAPVAVDCVVVEADRG